eukprot:15550-Lingulodinium_polyedra.AAC.1
MPDLRYVSRCNLALRTRMHVSTTLAANCSGMRSNAGCDTATVYSKHFRQFTRAAPYGVARVE